MESLLDYDMKILIRSANWVGDAIMTTPVIRAVRKHHPTAHITLLAKPWVVPVFHHNPHVDEIMVYESSGRHTKGWGTLRLAKDLRKRRFDVAILMQNAFEAALITFLAAVPRRIGYNTDGRTLLLSPAVKLDPMLKKGHLIDYYRGILKGASMVDDGRRIELFLTEVEKKYARILLENHGFEPGPSLPGPSGSNGVEIPTGTGISGNAKISGNVKIGGNAHPKPVIGINPGATGGTAKRWFPDRFADLANRLARRFDTRILIFGGPGDWPLGEDINRRSGGKCVNLAGKTTLREAFALIDRCDLFITNDSGLMHAAAALDTPQIGIIGPTRYLETGPVGEQSSIVRVQVACNPCKNVHCPVDHICMDNISVAMVMEKSLKIIESKGKNG